MLTVCGVGFGMVLFWWCEFSRGYFGGLRVGTAEMDVSTAFGSMFPSGLEIFRSEFGQPFGVALEAALLGDKALCRQKITQMS
jgi:hypothetical protein